MSRVIQLPKFMQSMTEAAAAKIIDVTPQRIPIEPDLEDLAQSVERTKHDKEVADDAHKCAVAKFNAELERRGLCKK